MAICEWPNELVALKILLSACFSVPVMVVVVVCFSGVWSRLCPYTKRRKSRALAAFLRNTITHFGTTLPRPVWCAAKWNEEILLESLAPTTTTTTQLHWWKYRWRQRRTKRISSIYIKKKEVTSFRLRIRLSSRGRYIYIYTSKRHIHKFTRW